MRLICRILGHRAAADADDDEEEVNEGRRLPPRLAYNLFFYGTPVVSAP